ncbi:copper resistance CopC family protein [Leucobacter sp. 7(1)]|uniref:copper resistance CopC family protein n=1 Tax=Leucobacter sp. 7(1) TaxID=1255613 RepID=UPI000B35B0FD|nr:copper resistance CopC family protein [Leucobacter sp. 7(1)]
MSRSTPRTLSPFDSATARVRTATRRRQGAVAAVFLIAGASLFGVASPALAHDELINTTVVTDEVTGDVQAFQLSFSNSIIEVGTEIIVTGPDGADAADGTPEIEGPKVTQGLQADLAPGEYTAAWRVVSSDGHPIEGAFGIAIDAAGGGEIVAAPAPSGPASETETEITAEGDSPSAQDSDGLPVGAIIAIVVGGVAVVGGGVTAAIVANRRRAQGMAADAAPGADS